MSIPDDTDPEALISRLAGPLSPPAREAFRRAAEDALARVPCLGEGAAYRAVAALQRAYFSPLDPRRAAWDISQELPGVISLAMLHPLSMEAISAASATTGSSWWGDRWLIGAVPSYSQIVRLWHCITWRSPATRSTTPVFASSAWAAAAGSWPRRRCFRGTASSKSSCNGTPPDGRLAWCASSSMGCSRRALGP